MGINSVVFRKIKSTVCVSLCVCLTAVIFCGCGDNKSGGNTALNSGGFSSGLKLIYPLTFAYETQPTYEWKGLKAGETVTLRIDKVDGEKTKKVFEEEGITGTNYKSDIKLEKGQEYILYFFAVSSDGTAKSPSNLKDGTTRFVCMGTADKKVNQNRNFSFEGKIEEDVLNNYLSRSMMYSLFSDGKDTAQMDEGARVILNTGAKLVSRSVGSWIPSATEELNFPIIKEKIEKIHKIDSDIIFEACIYECVGSDVNLISIPDWVFEAFGLEAESRCFNYDKMRFANGNYANQWGTGLSVPDITNTETQMFIYYRACIFINMGIESIHLGQANLIGANDYNNECWTKVIHMIRDYAAKNARRKWVLINAHYPSQKFVGSDGVLLVDFNIFPTRIHTPAGETSHASTEDNPQKVIIEVGNNNSLYKNSASGITPSGWTCDSLPYVVELDNYGGLVGNIDDASEIIWGYDEISWFANQPDKYRREFLEELYNQVKDFGDGGHLQMPGFRTAYLKSVGAQSSYFVDDAKYNENGFGDEETVISIWKKDSRK